MIPFQEWMPDQPPLESPGALVAENVIPYIGYYGPFKTLSTYTNALTDFCRGAAAGIDGSLNTYVFAGDETNLYRLSNAIWSDVSGATYATASGERWEFITYNDYMIATNFTDAVQNWLMGTDSAFSDLGTNTPKCRHLGVVGNFLVMGNTNDSGDGNRPFRVWWSPINSPDGDYTPDVDTQAGWTDLPLGDEVMGIVSGEVGLIIMKQAIYRMVYVGLPTIFQFDQIEVNRGAIAAGSIASSGGRTFYYAEDGFFMTDGRQSVPIGANRIDTFFRNDSTGDYTQMSSVIDPTRKLYILAYAGSGSDGVTPNKLLVYNWEANRWSIVIQTVQTLARLLTPGYTLEALDNINSSIDAFPSSLDSREWAGGAILFGAFGSDSKFGLFGGDTLEATIQTGELQLGAQKMEERQISGSPGLRSYVGGIRALIDSNSWLARIGHRELVGDAITWTSFMNPQSQTGIAPFRVDNRYHRAEIQIPQGTLWEQAQGIDIDVEASGDR